MLWPQGLPWMMTWEIEEDAVDAHTRTGLTPDKALAICEVGGSLAAARSSIFSIFSSTTTPGGMATTPPTPRTCC
ncbi:MAG: hypothetical protein JKP98_12375 [Rhodobacteraceae bacterium]|nr:hypothetical protein [Paracoccaceae bacterium]